MLCTASTGIAVLILPGGLNAHSTFKLPFGDGAVEDSNFNVKAEAERADVFRRTSLIFWHEIVLSSKYSPEALDLTLQDLHPNDLPSHGKTIIFSVNWRQVAPVLKFDSEVEIVEYALLSSHLWKHVQRFRLTVPMRD